MSDSLDSHAPYRPRWTLSRVLMTGLMGSVSFGVGLLLVIALLNQLFLPLVSDEVGLGRLATPANLEVLRSGDSRARFAVLTEMQRVAELPETAPVERATAEELAVAFDACRKDRDRRVARLAEQLLDRISGLAK